MAVLARRPKFENCVAVAFRVPAEVKALLEEKAHAAQKTLSLFVVEKLIEMAGEE